MKSSRTETRRSLRYVSCRVRIAVEASRADANVTRPQPLDRPLGSCITLARSTVPACSKWSLRSCELASQLKFESQLEADLSTAVRGGNKQRLVARVYTALINARGMVGKPISVNEQIKAYEDFRAIWVKKTFAQIHEAFDYVLPEKYRAK